MKKLFLLTSFTVILATAAFSQQLTKEDSLAAGLMASKSATVLSGYGSMQYSNNITTKQASTNIDRMVLFIGHKFNSKISFFSEIEIEDVGKLKEFVGCKVEIDKLKRSGKFIQSVMIQSFLDEFSAG